MVLIGSHVSMSGKKMLLGAAEEAASYNADTFMIYTGAPQNTRRKAIEEMWVRMNSLMVIKELQNKNKTFLSIKIDKTLYLFTRL